MSTYFNISTAERDELEECFWALEDLLLQLRLIGVPDWKGAEGLDLSRAEKIIADIRVGK